MNNQPFNEDQKQYLQGYFAGLQQSGDAPPFAGVTAAGALTARPAEASGGNLAAPASDAAEPSELYGTPYKNLSKEEKIKLAENPLDMWNRMVAMAEKDEFAEGEDIFRFKFHGLFNCKPNQDGYMLRCRMPGCCITAAQMDTLADIAETHGGGYAHVTTRGNIQIREIQPRGTIPTLLSLADAGLTSKGSGGDNIRNITCSPLSGVDPRELMDCRPFARAMHHYILNTREFYGLPRKFNIAFDGGGQITIMADTNDIGFFIVEVPEGQDLPAGLYARVEVGGVAGHGHFAKDLGILIRPEQMVAFAAAILRVFVREGNRANRKRARLVYCVEAMSHAAFLEAVKNEIDFDVPDASAALTLPRGPIDRFGHIGFHPQKQEDQHYVGVAMLVGRMSIPQMRAVADIARKYGSGDLRFTVWQNVILTGIKTEDKAAVQAALEAIEYRVETSCATAGLTACTGNTGCKLSQTDTKETAAEIARHLDAALKLRDPLNIVLTGCPNACAQHVCADIGLLGIKTKRDGESIEAYNISVGGGVGAEQGLARDFAKAVPRDEVPPLIERMLRVYGREAQEDESFLAYARRVEPDIFRNLVEALEV
ncbi:MAG: NirA family protein [Verrucomicrobia bacterium]|nr:NirA family protein [Verrucomicrobiota bacterium]MCH8528052.1 NirA family protein [Kiritimatiellia bacterium]